MGALRWRAPQPAARVHGVQDATQFGAVCPQVVSHSYAGFLANRTQSEECLTLNIWTPGERGVKRPVMVFIHPGSFLSGSGSFDSFDGSTAAQQGVVLVNINYRLGVFGFLRTRH